MRKVVDFVNVAVAAATGLYLVLLTIFQSDRLFAVPEFLTSPGLAFLSFLVGAFIAGANVWVLVKEWKMGGFRRNLRVTTDQGITDLSVAALEALLLRDLRAQGDIVEPVVTLHPRLVGKPMLCLLEFKLRRQKDVTKRIDVVKRLIRDIFDGLMPGGLTVDVRAEVRGFVHDDEEPGKRRDGEFEGPDYSVYDDGEGSAP